ncbi:hypothetical protein [Natrarchaeobius oligotrophus]|uniref:Uncharacterized protein n=1 Tax=Natrarchaeobius chitinivorans TaxID=1679083 RepID=A0A3N6NN94_NATCH|nr:hypothetical protein [Natrarchaeobius chitinivorans]RQH00993.1 hypothetical protein EA472_08650 [Natrarchaeobius chitinivorans]
MPETEQQDKTLSELIVKEAVGKGLDTPLRDSILEAVEEEESGRAGGRLSIAGAVFGLGAAIGFLAGRHAPALEETSIEEIEEPEIIETMGGDDESEEVTEVSDEKADADVEDDAGSSSRLVRLLVALGVLVGIALARRRLMGEEEDEWEPIEEFEPATTMEADDESEADAESETEDESGAEADVETEEE